MTAILGGESFWGLIGEGEARKRFFLKKEAKTFAI
jgi:hypothetical protein